MSPKRRRGLPKGAKRVRIEVAYHSRYREWQIREGSSSTRYIASTQVKAIAVAVSLALRIVRGGGFSSVRVHGRDGKFQREMTYPKWSDPCPPRG